MAVFFSPPFGRERARWRLHFLVVGSSSFGGPSGSGDSPGPDWTVAATASSVNRLVANAADGDCGFWPLARAASVGPDRTVAATAPIPVCSQQLLASSLPYASSDKIRSGTLRDQAAGKTGLDLYVWIISKPTVL
jgi:hypothetical protein